MEASVNDVVITEGTKPRVVSCPGHRWRLEDRTPEGMTAVTLTDPEPA